MLTIPANFSTPAREALMAAAKLAGLNVMRLVNEPTAAAIEYTERNRQSTERLLVFDFGGGTLDITILEKSGMELRVASTYGNRQLGGNQCDLLVAQFLQRHLQESFGNFRAATVPGHRVAAMGGARENRPLHGTVL